MIASYNVKVILLAVVMILSLNGCGDSSDRIKLNAQYNWGYGDGHNDGYINGYNNALSDVKDNEAYSSGEDSVEAGDEYEKR